MTDKEATIYVIDVGRSMRKKRSENGNETSLEWAMKYVLTKIQYKILSGRKTDKVAIIYFGTDKTKNELNASASEEYLNITIEFPLEMANMNLLERLRDKKPENSEGDILDALIIAIDHMNKQTRQLKYIRRICLITSGAYLVDSDRDLILAQLRERGIMLQILGVDFDDPTYPFKEEDKPATKRFNEEYLQRLADDAGGSFFTMLEALDESKKPFIREVKPVKTFVGELTLGDPNAHPDTALSISVELYPHRKVARPLAAKKYYPGVKKEAETENMDPMEHVVHMQRVYYLHKDDEDPSPVKVIEEGTEGLEKAFTYGRTLIPVRRLNEDILVLKTTKSMSIIGFFAEKTFDRFLLMGESFMLVAPSNDSISQASLSSLIHALYEKQSLALIRYVRTDKMDPPRLAVLIPHIKPDYECFWFIKLPFAEDVRRYQFASLDKVRTVTGKVYTEHRLLPTSEQLDSMDKFIDSWDLMKLDFDEEGMPEQYMKPKDIFHPGIHGVNQGIFHRALYPDSKEFPKVNPVLTRYDQPLAALVDKQKATIEKLIEVFAITKVEPRKKFSRKRDEVTADIGEIDIDTIFSREVQKKPKAKESQNEIIPEENIDKSLSQQVTLENPIESFKKMLEGPGDPVGNAVAQIFRVIKLLAEDNDDSKYQLAFECLKEVRREAIDESEVNAYNEFMIGLKSKLFDNKGNLVFWKQLTHYSKNESNLSLISVDESEESTISTIEQDSFMS